MKSKTIQQTRVSAWLTALLVTVVFTAYPMR
jgi:hypothetical protein